MPRFAGTYMQTPNTSQDVHVTITDTGLALEFKSDPPQHWPFENIYAGQIGQGEAMCIAHNTSKDRIYTAYSHITAVQSAQKGEPFKIKRAIPWGPILLVSFLGLCALVAFFAKY